MYCTILYLFMLSLHIGRVAETHWVNSGMQKLQLPSLPAQGGSHSAFLHLGSMAISNFRLDRCDQFRSVTSGFTAPWFLTALRKIDWETAWKHQENCSEIKHDWTCRFQLLERDDQYDWKLWLHWCLGWKLLHDCTMCYTSIWSACMFSTRLVCCKKWSDMEIVWSLSLQAEVFWTLWRICPWWTIAFGLCWE